jgi:hypothetical protein
LNKLQTHREVGLADAISYLLGLPDQYTTATFVKLHTNFLLSYIRRLWSKLGLLPMANEEDGNRTILEPEDTGLDSNLVLDQGVFTLVSPLDDYCYRGPALRDYCLYDYASIVYKRKSLGGIPFAPEHPQAKTHSQYLREVSSTNPAPVPTLLGRILFVRPDSDDIKVVEEYYGYATAMFSPWSIEDPPNPNQMPWKDWYSDRLSPSPNPRIARLVDHLALLHKSKQEAEFDRLRRAALEGEEDGEEGARADDEMDLDEMDLDEMEAALNDQDADEDDGEWDDSTLSIAHEIDNRLYTLQGMDSSFDFGYLNRDSSFDHSGRHEDLTRMSVDDDVDDDDDDDDDGDGESNDILRSPVPLNQMIALMNTQLKASDPIEDTRADMSEPNEPSYEVPRVLPGTW